MSELTEQSVEKLKGVAAESLVANIGLKASSEAAKDAAKAAKTTASGAARGINWPGYFMRLPVGLEATGETVSLDKLLDY